MHPAAMCAGICKATLQEGPQRVLKTGFHQRLFCSVCFLQCVYIPSLSLPLYMHSIQIHKQGSLYRSSCETLLLCAVLSPLCTCPSAFPALLFQSAPPSPTGNSSTIVHRFHSTIVHQPLLGKTHQSHSSPPPCAQYAAHCPQWVA